MAKYRVETKFTNLSENVTWGPHVVEFDTEVDSYWLIKDRFRSIGKVILRMIRKHEGLSDPNGLPMALSGKDLNDQFKAVLDNPPE